MSILLNLRSNNIPDKQAWQNRSTAGQWDLYSSHRRAMERLLVPEARGAKQVCVLGAGNCNDLDLGWLTRAYREVHLVDIDPNALQAATRRQKVEGKVVLHAPVDLTGAADIVSGWRGTPTDGQADDYVRRVRTAGMQDLGRFDVVLSPCVLSQLIHPVRELLGSHHPKYHEVRAAIRWRHLRLMHSMLDTGGEAVLAVDLVSSQTFEGLARVDERDLGDLMRRLLADGRFFKGLQPAAIESTLKDDPRMREHLRSLRFSEPWRWHLALNKCFLVYAATWRNVK